MIRVQLFAAFAEFAGSRELKREYHAGITCQALWEQLLQDFPRFAGIPVLFAIGSEYVSSDSELRDGDSVLLFPPLSGGNVSYLHDDPLSIDRALEAIRHLNGGGEALFIGRVRQYSEGKKIRHLHYECEAGMADSQISTIIDEMHTKWTLCCVHVEHRTGKLEVGEIAVIIAVSAEHRKEALEACRYGIDELKRRVPIWKKEVSDEGEEWVGCGP